MLLSQHQFFSTMFFLLWWHLTSWLACRPTIDPPNPNINYNPSAKWRNVIQQASSPRGVHFKLIQQNQHILDDYLSWVAIHGPQSDQLKLRDEDVKITFYANAYNAFVVSQILKKQHDAAKPFQFLQANARFFSGLLFRVDSQWMSLYHLKTERLLVDFQAPRIHFMLSDGTPQAPTLRWWSAKNLTKQLRQAASDYINSPKGHQKSKDSWLLSDFFAQRQDQFLRWSYHENLCQYIYPFAKQELKKWLHSKRDDCQIQFFTYSPP